MLTHKTAKIFFSIFAALFLVFAVAGQEEAGQSDATATPDSDMEMTEEADMDEMDMDDEMVDTTSGAIEATLEEIAAMSSDYFGQRVIVEGTVETFLNAKTFVLGEEAILDNDQVLVFNMTEDDFDLRVSNEAEVRVTGVILPSLEEREVNAYNEFDFWTPLYTPVDDSGMNYRVDPLLFFYNGELADDYEVYTVLVVEDIDNISTTPEASE